MREIKFRAWHKKLGMITPAALRTNGGTVTAIDNDGFGKHYGLDAGVALMQYTGLKDRNGVEIYEGDILASDPLYDGFQTFSTIEMGWSSVDGNEYGWHWRNGPPVRPVDMVDERYSVIGNIYENPELLEANQ